MAAVQVGLPPSDFHAPGPAAGLSDGDLDSILVDMRISEVDKLVLLADIVCNPRESCAMKEQALEFMCVGLRPNLAESYRVEFVRRALALGVVEAAVALVELGVASLACAASNFLGDLCFNSDPGAYAVLAVFPRLERVFRHIFADRRFGQARVLDAAILLCANIAATCPSGHSQLVPLVQPICLEIIKHPHVSDKIRGNTILLLANLSMTVGPELRELRVADALLQLVVQRRATADGLTVAESVVIFLHGHKQCQEIDTLMHLGVIGNYVVPIMEQTLQGEDFRGMYPHLMYSARLFQVLAQCRAYAEALIAHPKVIPMLLRVCENPGRPLRVESDLEGRRLALEALWSLARWRLWPPADLEWSGCPSKTFAEVEAIHFFDHCMPELLAHEHRGIRAASAGLWAEVHREEVLQQLLCGVRLENMRGLPAGFWKCRIMSYSFPFLGRGLDGWCEAGR